MLDDQTESIRNLKQVCSKALYFAVVATSICVQRITEAGEKLEQVREEAGQAQDELEDQLGQSQAQNQDMEEQLASLVDRKEELKDQLARARDDLEKERTKHWYTIIHVLLFRRVVCLYSNIRDDITHQWTNNIWRQIDFV